VIAVRRDSKIWLVAAALVAVLLAAGGAYVYQEGQQAQSAAKIAALEQLNSDAQARIDALAAQWAAIPTVTVAPSDAAAPPAEPAGTPSPAPAEPKPVNKKVFGRIKQIDPSGAVPADNWVHARVVIDEMSYLTGSKAKAYLESIGQGANYASSYWYAKNASTKLTTYVADDPDAVQIVMYTYPTPPSVEPYWPNHLTAHNGTMADFYAWVYDDGKADQLLQQRLYWVSIEAGSVVKIVEQPRDPYYEP
jgi:hypothetical protein